MYDVVSGQFISKIFTKIGSFGKVNEESEEEFAKAVVRLPYGKGTRNVCDVVCYIDKTGQIRTPLYNPNDDSYIDTSSEDFDFERAIEGIKSQIQEQVTQENAGVNKFVKAITSRKQTRN